MLTSLFTNRLLCLSLAHLLIEFKLGFKLDLFAKINEHKQVFSQAKSELFINSLVHLQH